MTITFERESAGWFKVLRDGKPTDVTIHNGSLGMSGHDTKNTYGLSIKGRSKPIWIGTLPAAKKAAINYLSR